MSYVKEIVYKVKIVLNDVEIFCLIYWNIVLILYVVKCRNKKKVCLRCVLKEKISVKMKNFYNEIKCESFK